MCSVIALSPAGCPSHLLIPVLLEGLALLLHLLCFLCPTSSLQEHWLHLCWRPVVSLPYPLLSPITPAILLVLSHFLSPRALARVGYFPLFLMGPFYTWHHCFPPLLNSASGLFISPCLWEPLLDPLCSALSWFCKISCSFYFH